VPDQCQGSNSGLRVGSLLGGGSKFFALGCAFDYSEFELDLEIARLI
jgi:hypothetical protein